jgi:hypothetical protein
MTPLVVVQNNFVERLTGPMARAARHAGVALHDVSSGAAAEANPLPPGGPWGPILVMGSVLFVHQWARGEPELTPWVFWDDARYDAALWADALGTEYLNAGGRATSAGAFAASDTGAMHIRPRSGIKMIGEGRPTESKAGPQSVPGIVATPCEFALLGVDPDTPIWTSPPTRIDAEIRTWMIGGRAVASSTYRVAGTPTFDAGHPLVAEAIAHATGLHDVWHPGRHYVVDLAMTPDGWRVIEYNPIHSSGWYDADPALVLTAYMAAERHRS